MAKLKSSYELAMERIIASSNKKSPKKSPIVPEFVTDVEYPENLGKSKKEPVIGREKIVEPSKKYYDEEVVEAYWAGQFFDYGGFARMNRSMVFGLSNKNAKIKLEIESFRTDINKATQDFLNQMTKVKIDPKAPKVYSSTVPTGFLNHKGAKVIYTMIETSEKVHNDYVGKLDMADEIWVPTEYGKKILESSGVKTKVVVMPLGVDVSRFTEGSGGLKLSSKKYKFLSVFRWSYRKGFDILLKSYLEEFSSKDDVSLVLVSRATQYPGNKGVKHIQSQFIELAKSIGKPIDELPEVVLYTEPIKERDMPKLYQSCDSFVLMSRGEGFGLPLVEAGACGLPIVSTNCSGHSDFLKEEWSYLVEPDAFVTASTSGYMSQMAKLCHFYDGQVFPDFGLPAIGAAKRIMRNIFENQDEAKEKAEKFRKHVVENYSWDSAIDKVYNRLRELQ